MLNKLVVYVGIGIAALIIIGALAVQNAGIRSSQTPQPNQAVGITLSAEELEEIERLETLRQDAYSRAYDAEFAALEAKESSVRAIVYSDERIQAHIAGAYSHQEDLTRADLTGNGTDELLIYVVGQRLPVEGDWRTSYNRTYTGIFELKVSVKGAQILSIEKIPKDDVTNIVTFSDGEKQALELAFANPDVAAAVQVKDILVQNVMYVSFGKGSGCPPGSCVFIHLEQPSRGKFLPLFFNTSEDKVFLMENGKGQIGEGW
jgi:hypothetical protein